MQIDEASCSLHIHGNEQELYKEVFGNFGCRDITPNMYNQKVMSVS
jgi:hypothetical protein